jgi:hypothetical protein
MITPSTLTQELGLNQTATQNITVTNAGGCNLNYTTSPGSTDYALKFDGVDDYINISDANSLRIQEDITLETWINFEEGGSMQPRIISKGADGGNGYELLMTHTGSSRNLEFRIGPGGGGIEIHLISQSILNAGEWYHCAVSYDGSRIDMYINGMLDASVDTSGSLVTTFDDLCIGQKSTPAWDKYKGYIDEVRIWEIARTQVEIQQNMNNQLSGNEPGLVGYWSFNEGIGDIVYDKTVNNNHGTLQGGLQWIPVTR